MRARPAPFAFVIAALAPAAFAAPPAQADTAQASTAQATLGATPVTGGGAYSTGGGVTVAVEMRRSTDGRPALCGAWAETAQQTVYLRGKGRDVLKHGSVSVDGQIVAQGLEFLREVPPAQSYAGAPANCIALPTGTSGTPTIQFAPVEVLNMRNGRLSGGLVVRFNQSRSANPAMEKGSLLPRAFTSFTSSGGEGRTHR